MKVYLEISDWKKFESNWNSCFIKQKPDPQKRLNYRLNKKRAYLMMRRYNMPEIVIEGASTASEGTLSLISQGEEVKVFY